MACAIRHGGAGTRSTGQATNPSPRATRPPIRGSPRLRQENGRRKGLRRPSLAHSGGERSEFHARAELHRPIILLELKEILTGSDIVVRSEERRVGKEGVSKSISRGSPNN